MKKHIETTLKEVLVELKRARTDKTNCDCGEGEEFTEFEHADYHIDNASRLVQKLL